MNNSFVINVKLICASSLMPISSTAKYLHVDGNFDANVLVQSFGVNSECN